MKCKITNDNLKPFMSFGKMPSANGFLEEKDFHNEFKLGKAKRVKPKEKR